MDSIFAMQGIILPECGGVRIHLKQILPRAGLYRWSEEPTLSELCIQINMIYEWISHELISPTTNVTATFSHKDPSHKSQYVRFFFAKLSASWLLTLSFIVSIQNPLLCESVHCTNWYALDINKKKRNQFWHDAAQWKVKSWQIWVKGIDF